MRKLLIVAVATMFAFTMNAQKFGVKLGANMSGYLTNYDTSKDSKMGKGLNIAALAELPVSDAMGLRIDLGLNQLGSDSKSEEGENSFKSQTNINYLKLGVSPKFAFGPAYVAVGPYFGYAISGKTKWERKSGSETTSGTENFFTYEDENGKEVKDEFYKKTDLGLNLAVGADFDALFVEFNVGMGMTNFFNKDDKGYKGWTDYAKQLNEANADASDYNFHEGTKAVEMPKAKNLFFGLSVGYMFGE